MTSYASHQQETSQKALFIKKKEKKKRTEISIEKEVSYLWELIALIILVSSLSSAKRLVIMIMRKPECLCSTPGDVQYIGDIMSAV